MTDGIVMHYAAIVLLTIAISIAAAYVYYRKRKSV